MSEVHLESYEWYEKRVAELEADKARLEAELDAAINGAELTAEIANDRLEQVNVLQSRLADATKESDERHDMLSRANRAVDDLAGKLAAAEKEQDILRDEAKAYKADSESLQTRLREAEKQRDLAITHDRQPYPTAWSYEQACRVLSEKLVVSILTLALRLKTRRLRSSTRRPRTV